jgi:hypothetical protein
MVTSRLGRFLLAACAHALVTLCLIVYASASSSAAFDNPDMAPSRIGEAAAHVAGVLLLPCRLLWTPWASQNLPNSLEWVGFLANSGLWSLGILAAAAMVSRAMRRSRAA